MDDIFDKLDDLRIEKLIALVQKYITGQLFISDARPDRSSVFFQSNTKDFRMFIIDQGKITISDSPFQN